MESIFTKADADRAILESATRPVFIYKHSPICELCDDAILEWQQFMKADADRFTFYQVDVIAAREASKYIEQQLNVRHESPQVLMISDKNCVWHASHRAIKGNKMRSEADQFFLSR